MTVEYSYYAMQYSECINGETKFWASAERIPRCYNLVGFCRDERVKSMMSCKTFKEAKEIARAWNDTYKANGVRAY